MSATLTEIASVLGAAWLVSGIVFGLALAALTAVRRLSGAAQRTVARLGLGVAVVTLAAGALTPVLAPPLSRVAAPVAGLLALDPPTSGGAVPAAAASPGSVPILPTVCVVLWLAGIGVGAVRLLRAAGRLRKIVRAAEVSSSREGVAVAEVNGPCLVGWRRQLLLLPRDADYSDRELERILAHEREHVRSGDLPWIWLMRLTRLAFWPQPAVHWFEARFHLVAEHAADEAAIVQTGDPSGYVATLLRIRPAADAVPVAGMGAFRSELGRRAERILGSPPPERGPGARRRLWLVAAGLPTAVALVIVPGLILTGCGESRSPYDISLVEAEASGVMKRSRINGVEWAKAELRGLMKKYPREPLPRLYYAWTLGRTHSDTDRAEALKVVETIKLRSLPVDYRPELASLHVFLLAEAGRPADARVVVADALGQAQREAWPPAAVAQLESLQRDLADK